jgi:hypothetical protein
MTVLPLSQGLPTGMMRIGGGTSGRADGREW